MADPKKPSRKPPPKFPIRFLKDLYPVLRREWTEAGYTCPRPDQLGQGRNWKEFTVTKGRIPVTRYERRGDFYFRDVQAGRVIR